MDRYDNVLDKLLDVLVNLSYALLSGYRVSVHDGPFIDCTGKSVCLKKVYTLFYQGTSPCMTVHS